MILLIKMYVYASEMDYLKGGKKLLNEVTIWRKNSLKQTILA